MRKDVVADRLRRVPSCRDIFRFEGYVESVGYGKAHVSGTDLLFDARGDGCVKPSVVPTRERRDIGQEKGRIEEIDRMAGKRGKNYCDPLPILCSYSHFVASLSVDVQVSRSVPPDAELTSVKV